MQYVCYSQVLQVFGRETNGEDEKEEIQRMIEWHESQLKEYVTDTSPCTIHYYVEKLCTLYTYMLGQAAVYCVLSVY